MKKNLSNCLFCRLGLIISTYALSHCNVKIQAEEGKPSTSLNALASLWPISGEQDASSSNVITDSWNRDRNTGLVDTSDLDFDLSPLSEEQVGIDIDNEEAADPWGSDRSTPVGPTDLLFPIQHKIHLPPQTPTQEAVDPYEPFVSPSRPLPGRFEEPSMRPSGYGEATVSAVPQPSVEELKDEKRIIAEQAPLTLEIEENLEAIQDTEKPEQENVVEDQPIVLHEGSEEGDASVDEPSEINEDTSEDIQDDFTEQEWEEGSEDEQEGTETKANVPLSHHPIVGTSANVASPSQVTGPYSPEEPPSLHTAEVDEVGKMEIEQIVQAQKETAQATGVSEEVKEIQEALKGISGKEKPGSPDASQIDHDLQKIQEKEKAAPPTPHMPDLIPPAQSLPEQEIHEKQKWLEEQEQKAEEKEEKEEFQPEINQEPEAPTPKAKSQTKQPAAEPQPATKFPPQATQQPLPTLPSGEAPSKPENTPAEAGTETEEDKTILINFNNVSAVELIRFISRISNKNFVFDENDLDFTVTIVAEEPTSIDNVLTAFIQVLRIHNLTVLEQKNNIIIHNNLKVNGISKVIANDLIDPETGETEIVTQVFRLNTLEPDKAASIIRPLVSERALVESLQRSGHLIITDLISNVKQIGFLIKSIDSPQNGLVVGQYKLRTGDMNTLIPLAQEIMRPISLDQPLVFVPHQLSNSIFIVSTQFLTERSIFILQHLDQKQGETTIFDLKDLSYQPPKEDVEEEKERQRWRARELGYPDGEFPPEEEEEVPIGRWMLDSEGSLVFKIVRKEEIKKEEEEAAKQDKEVALEMAQKAQEELDKLLQEELERLIRDEVNALKRTAQLEGRAELLEAELKAAERAAKEKLKEREKEIKTVVKKDVPWDLGVNELTGEPYVVPRCPPIPTPLPITTEIFNRPSQATENFLPGPVNKTKFYIHKLNYRSGDAVATAIKQIAFSLQEVGKGNEELISTVSTVQWLQETNSLVFSGTPEYLEKCRELVEQIDMPLRQVFIEMLILITNLNESLEYGVNWLNRNGGGDNAGAQGFLAGPSLLPSIADTTGVTLLGDVKPIDPTEQYQQSLIPDPTNFVRDSGFRLGIIGEHIVHRGLGLSFNSLGALITAVHDKQNVEIVMNPKIITEDNVPAEVFVGQSVAFKTQSIANDFGTTITNNFQYSDVGTSLRVTPHIGASDVVTLEIAQEVSELAPQVNFPGNTNLDVQPTTNTTKTTTRVHVPNKYFVIISGLMQDRKNHSRNQTPCLGTVPILGGAFKRKNNEDRKQNLMVFIRPEIIDTDDEYQNVTRHQQDIWSYKNQAKKTWVYETEEALDFLNTKRTFNIYQEDEDCCEGYNH